MSIMPKHVTHAVRPTEGAPAGCGGPWAANAAPRHCPSPLGVLLPALGAALTAALLWLGVAAGPVYTVAEVRAYLAHGPERWVGRTVRIRAMLVGCPDSGNGSRLWCSPTSWQPELADPTGPGARDPLPVSWGGPDPLPALLRQLPAVGGFAPGPQADSWGAVAIHRVRLDVAPANTLWCTAVCYVAVLLDTAVAGE